MVYDYFKIRGTSEALLDVTDLTKVTLKGDKVRGVNTKWDETVLSVKTIPDEEILEYVYKLQLRTSE